MDDEPFFREWSARVPGERRSLARASSLAQALGLAVGDLHPLVVVGSKGKGTTATFAAATLRAAGLRVGLITSPGYRSHRERVRVDGASLTAAAFAAMASSLHVALSSLPPRSPGAGYVSPTGAFTLAGLAWLVGQDVDALVVEAGMGGASDESSLTLPSVVAVTPIFEEHLDVLGPDLASVARDKAGTINEFTRSVVTAPQSPEVLPLIEAALTPLIEPAPETGAKPAPVSGAGSSLAAINAGVGHRAAQEYLKVLGHPAAPEDLPEVRLPGRQSLHRLGDQTWALDSAISPPGIDAALSWCRNPTTVLLSIPDTKDREACLKALAGHPVVEVRARASHLTFPPGLPALTDLSDLGDRVLALGTISFIGEVLDMLDVDMERLF